MLSDDEGEGSFANPAAAAPTRLTLPSLCSHDGTQGMKVADAYRYKFPARTHEIGAPDYWPGRGVCAPMAWPPSACVSYECLQCDVRWPGNVGPAQCPECGSAYVLWLNR